MDSWVEVAGQLGAEEYILSLAVYSNSLYGGTYSGGRLYKFFEDIIPYNNQQNVPIDTILKALVIDNDDDTMNVSFYWDNDSLIEMVTGVANNTYAETSSLSLNYGTTYSWYAVANDSELETTGDAFTFTTGSPPVISNEYPENGSVGHRKRPLCRVNVTDPDGDTVDVSFYENTTGAWVRRHNETVTGTVVYWDYTDAARYGTTYWWKVVADDGAGNTTGVYHFTTGGRPSKEKEEGEPAPEVRLPPAGISPETVLVGIALFACAVLAAAFVWIYYKW